MIYKFIPSNINETEKPVDNLGGFLSLIFLGGLILAINFAPIHSTITITALLVIIAVVTGVFFIIRQRRAKTRSTIWGLPDDQPSWWLPVPVP